MTEDPRPWSQRFFGRKMSVYLITLAVATIAEIRSPGSPFATQIAGAIALALPVLLAAQGAVDYKRSNKGTPTPEKDTTP